MAVRIQDRYEMRGMFFRYDASEVEWEAWPACVGNQEVSFHPSTYEVTKNQKDAIQWAVDHAELPNAHGIFREWADYTPSH